MLVVAHCYYSCYYFYYIGEFIKKIYVFIYTSLKLVAVVVRNKDTVVL